MVGNGVALGADVGVADGVNVDVLAGGANAVSRAATVAWTIVASASTVGVSLGVGEVVADGEAVGVAVDVTDGVMDGVGGKVGIAPNVGSALTLSVAPAKGG